MPNCYGIHRKRLIVRYRRQAYHSMQSLHQRGDISGPSLRINVDGKTKEKM